MKKFEELTDFEKTLRSIYEEYRKMSKNTGVKFPELLQVVRNRELVLLNKQLERLNNHLDSTESKNPNPQSKEEKIERR